jgi:hypothetical protein
MFIAAWFTIAERWRQPRCPSADERLKKMWCISTMEIKKNKIMSFTGQWMKLEIIVLGEIQHTEKKQILHLLSHTQNLDQKNK